MQKVKGTITRRMEKILGGLEEEFKALYTRTDFENAYAELKEAKDYSDRPVRLKKLYGMFDDCGIPYQKGQKNSYYRRLIDGADLPDYSQVEEKMMFSLYKMYQEYLSPEDYMKRLVDKLSEKFPDHSWKKDTLRLRILKQFIKYGNYLHDAEFGGKEAIRKYVRRKRETANGIEAVSGGKKGGIPDEIVLDELDDGVFELLENASKAQRKPKGTYGLLKVADDLAFGKFRAEGATKKQLYLFAMVYGMTYYTGSENGAEFVDFSTDIETNLFRDFYANNMIRFITDAYKGKIEEYEKDPSGQGINYKNFAEMVYLYFISREYEPQKKIRLSAKMIKDIKDRSRQESKPETSSGKGTVFYRNLFTEDILRMPEEEFEQFILDHYDCNVYDGTYEKEGKTYESRKSEMQLNTEQNTAFAVYGSILKALNSLPNRRNCNYGLWFTDVSAFASKGYKTLLDDREDIDPKRLEDFKKLLLRINDLAGYTFSENEVDDQKVLPNKGPSIIDTKALNISRAEDVSRTSIIIAFYYYFNELHIDDRNRSFEEVYKSFEKEINPKLEEAFYQKINGKNIFDVLMVFSSYAWQNL